MCCGGNQDKDKQKKAPLNTDSKKKKSNQKQVNAQIVLLGNVAVGQTSITQRYRFDKFEEQYYNTLGASYIEKTVTAKNGESVQLNIWDTAGDERYRAQAAILIYDVTDANTFKDLSFWIQELETNVESQGLIMCLVGNKNDVPPEEKRVSTAMAETFAKENNLFSFECSAKTGEGIEQIFNQIVSELANQTKE